MNNVPEPKRVGLGMPVNEYLSQGFKALNWMSVVLYGLGAGLFMPFSLMQSNLLAIVAGAVPVTIGLLLARSTKTFYGLHGFVTGLIAAITSTVFLGILIFAFDNGSLVQQLAPEATTPMNTWLTASGFMAFSLIVFCTFGTVVTGRMEERTRELQQQTKDRGGRLTSHGAIREVSDVRGLALPQLGHFVNTLFKKKGYVLKDYKFVDKDKYCDLWYEYQDATWYVRCVVAEKVPAGAVESLHQEMKRMSVTKGIVVASTDFAATATKSAKEKRIVLIDGDLLFEITR